MVCFCGSGHLSSFSAGQAEAPLGALNHLAPSQGRFLLCPYQRHSLLWLAAPPRLLMDTSKGGSSLGATGSHIQISAWASFPRAILCLIQFANASLHSDEAASVGVVRDINRVQHLSPFRHKVTFSGPSLPSRPVSLAPRPCAGLRVPAHYHMSSRPLPACPVFSWMDERLCPVYAVKPKQHHVLHNSQQL